MGVLVEAKAVLLAMSYANCWPMNGGVGVYGIQGRTFLIGIFQNGVEIVSNAPNM